ncbi:MAG: DUF1003 domain-containing protein [Nanobdellota archaeon]
MKKKEIKNEEIRIISHPNTAPSNFAQKAADKLTKSIGSWVFIIIFLLILVAWILLIVYLPEIPPELDHFLILNLFLSCVAAIQAPIILMSQNRASQKDRQRMEYDYLVDKKSEKEIEQIKKQLDRIERKLGN